MDENYSTSAGKVTALDFSKSAFADIFMKN